MSRTNRRDILDNFEDPQQVAELVALIATMPGCKLTVRRSRRRPMRLLRWHADRPAGLTPQESLANLLQMRDLFYENEEDFDGLDKLYPVGVGWWLSPAQRGRQTGKKQVWRTMGPLFKSTLNLWHGNPTTLDTFAPPVLTRASLLAAVTREANRPREPLPPLFVSPTQLREWELLGFTETRREVRTLGVVSAVDAKTKTITISAPAPKSRRPAFIPVRRLDGRR